MHSLLSHTAVMPHKQAISNPSVGHETVLLVHPSQQTCATVLLQRGRRMMCGDCTLQSSVEYEYFKERFSVSCAASFSKVSISVAAEWLPALP